MKIVCIGDSLTRGYGVAPEDNWVALLNERSKHEFVNKGINGDTTGGMLSRFQRDVISQDARYVIIMGGANDFIMDDSLGSVQANIMAMVHQAYHYGIIPIIGTGLKAREDSFRKDWAEITDVNSLNKKNAAYRNWILRFCRVFHTRCIDFYGEFEKRTIDKQWGCLYDGLHPSEEGHRILADIAYGTIPK